MVSSTVIDERGDVVLVLQRKNDSKELRLLVNSQVLSLASPVFRAMFDNRFSEGLDLSPVLAKEISLPDDDADHMRYLCNLIHFQTSKLPLTIDITTLAGFVVLCDKYNCVEAVSFGCRYWITKWLHASEAKDMEKLLFVTYILDLPSEFKKVTQILIKRHTFGVDMMSAMNGRDVLPVQLFARLQAESLDSFDHVASRISDAEIESNLFNNSLHDSHGALVLGTWAKAMNKAGLWPLKAISIADYRERIENMLSMLRYNNRIDLDLDLDAILQDVDRAIEDIQGLCLDCIKKEAGDGKNRPCRIAHPKVH